MPFATPDTVRKASTALFAAVTVSLLWLSVRPAKVPPPPPPPEQEDCVGTAIVVRYAYNGGINTPHECRVQCEDDEPRYILYSNGQATQCEEPPGCLDLGEDKGITCVPPNATTIEAELEE